MKNLFSKSLMAAAAVMMFASCSNEEVLTPENPYEGKSSEVTIGMSVKGVGSKASADEVNLGTDINDINNIVVVPMIGNAYQNPIKFGNLEGNNISGVKGTTKVKTTLAQNVTRFKVYGNVIDEFAGVGTYENLSQTAVFPGFTFTAPTWDDKAPSTPSGVTYSKPHGLYYYVDTEDINGFSASESEWGTDSEPSWTSNQKLVGNNKSIKIGSVHYAVGLIAALIKNGDDTTLFYDSNSEGNLSGNEANFSDRTTAPLKVTGITIAKQSKSFDSDFTATGGEVYVYETAAKQDIYKDDSKVNDGNRGIANIYSVVAPTTEESVTLNIEFEVAEGTYFKTDGGAVMKPGDKCYLPVVLKKSLATSGSADIFEADKATFLNAKVMDWGLISKDVVESTDVTIGVEFDVEWGAGLQFDLEI